MKTTILKKLPAFIVMLILSIVSVFILNITSVGTSLVHSTGLTDMLSYSDVIEILGEPLSQTSETYGSGTTYYTVCYDGLRFVFECDRKKNPSSMMNMSITGDKYRAGFASVGANVNLLKKLYRFKRKVKDLPENRFGIIEEDFWTEFKFNENDTVEEIMIIRSIDYHSFWDLLLNF